MKRCNSYIDLVMNAILVLGIVVFIAPLVIAERVIHRVIHGG
jgi:hypothetical protein